MNSAASEALAVVRLWSYWKDATSECLSSRPGEPVTLRIRSLFAVNPKFVEQILFIFIEIVLFFLLFSF